MTGPETSTPSITPTGNASSTRAARPATSGPNDAFRPVRLAADAGAQSLTVEWADGHVSVYSYEGLRRACPCAECRGGHADMAQPVDPVVFHLPSLMTYEIKELRPAGHYALQVVWGDGHGSGLFRWEALRGYCPCDACVDSEQESL